LGDSFPPQDVSGVYVWTVPVEGAYFVHYVGESPAIVNRWSDHQRDTLGGRSVIYDPDLLRGGIELKALYGDKGYATNLFEFTEVVARSAYENARICSRFLAVVDGVQRVRRSVESAIISALRNDSTNAARLLSNKGVSIDSANAVKIRCRSSWPTGIRVVGVPNEIEYGQNAE
jgi:hypothetical protein